MARVKVVSFITFVLKNLISKNIFVKFILTLSEDLFQYQYCILPLCVIVSYSNFDSGRPKPMGWLGGVRCLFKVQNKTVFAPFIWL